MILKCLPQSDFDARQKLPPEAVRKVRGTTISGFKIEEFPPKKINSWANLKS